MFNLMLPVIKWGEAHLGAAHWAPDNWTPCHLGAGHLGGVSSYEEKTMKQAIP